MYNESITEDYIRKQLTSCMQSLQYSFEILNIEIIRPDLTVNYVRNQLSCEFKVRVKYKIDGVEALDTLVYPYEINNQFVFNRQGFNAKPKIAIVIAVYSPTVVVNNSGYYFTDDGLYFNIRKQDRELAQDLSELEDQEVKPIRYNNEYLSLDKFNELYPNFKWSDRTHLRAKLIAKDNNLPNDFDSVLGVIVDTDPEQFNKINIVDLDFQDASAALSSFLYQNRWKIAYKIRSKYENKGEVSIKEIQKYIYRCFQVNTSANLQSPSVTNPISLQSNCKKLYVQKYNRDSHNLETLTLEYNQSLYGAICPLKTIDSAMVNKKNEASACMEFHDGSAYLHVYDRDMQECDISIEEYVTHKVVCSESWDYEAGKMFDHPTYTQFGRIYTWNSDEPLDWDYLHLENGEFSVGMSCIPMINSTDSTRSTLGAHMLDQALPVNGGEDPIVYTEGMATNITERADYSGVITKITPEGIEIRSGERVYNQPYPEPKYSSFHSQCYYKCNRQIGDEVELGDPIFTLQGYENGIKMGVNLNVAYMHVGYDYEDGIAIRSGIASKFTHRMKTEIVKEFDKWIPDDKTDEIYDHGLIRVGTKVVRDSILFEGTSELNSKGKIVSSLGRMKLPVKTIYPLIHNGIVTDIQIVTNDDSLPESWSKYIRKDPGAIRTKFLIKIEYDNYPKVGDKFTNLYGSKGVCCKIIPDEEMYMMEDGTYVDAIVSPTSTIGRKGLSQLKCGFLADCAKKLWKDHEKAIADGTLDLPMALDDLKTLTLSLRFDDMTMDEFIAYHNSTANLKSYRIRSKTMETRFTYEKLQEIADRLHVDIRGEHTLHNNKYTVEDKIVVNTQYMTRLHFIVEDKSTATALNYKRDLQLESVTNKSGGQKIGEQETLAFMAQGMDPSEVLSLSRNSIGEEFLLQMLLLGQGIQEISE